MSEDLIWGRISIELDRRVRWFLSEDAQIVIETSKTEYLVITKSDLMKMVASISQLEGCTLNRAK